jgi:hypothetical protein
LKAALLALVLAGYTLVIEITGYVLAMRFGTTCPPTGPARGWSGRRSGSAASLRGDQG